MKKTLFVIIFFVTTIALNAKYYVPPGSETGTAIFECKMKGTEGKIEIFKKDGSGKKLGEMTFIGDEGKCVFHYKVQLEPGDYSWKFRDNKKNEDYGEISIKSGETKSVILFDNK